MYTVDQFNTIESFADMQMRALVGLSERKTPKKTHTKQHQRHSGNLIRVQPTCVCVLFYELQHNARRRQAGCGLRMLRVYMHQKCAYAVCAVSWRSVRRCLLCLAVVFVSRKTAKRQRTDNVRIAKTRTRRAYIYIKS